MCLFCAIKFTHSTIAAILDCQIDLEGMCMAYIEESNAEQRRRPDCANDYMSAHMQLYLSRSLSYLAGQFEPASTCRLSIRAAFYGETFVWSIRLLPLSYVLFKKRILLHLWRISRLLITFENSLDPD